MVYGAAGGIRELCDLLDEYGDAIEADFTQFYCGLDIADVWRGELTPRRALVLVEQLGYVPGSRFRALTIGSLDFVGWNRESAVLADIHDALQDNSVVTIKAAGGKAQRPEAYPRPVAASSQSDETVEVMDIDDFPIHLVIAMTQK